MCKCEETKQKGNVVCVALATFLCAVVFTSLMLLNAVCTLNYVLVLALSLCYLILCLLPPLYRYLLVSVV